VLRTRNKYCSNCLSTQRFIDLGASLVCERCSKRLEVVDSGLPPRTEGRVVPWSERYERPLTRTEATTRREAM